MWPSTCGCRGEILEPPFERLVATGFAERRGDAYWLTLAGTHQIDLFRAETLNWLTTRLAQSSGLQTPPDKGAVHRALERITQDVLVQRDWAEDETRAMRLRPPTRSTPRPVPPSPSRRPPAPMTPAGQVASPPRRPPAGRPQPPRAGRPVDPPTDRMRPPGPPGPPGPPPGRPR